MDHAVRARAQAAIGHAFADPLLLECALRHASVADSRLDSNERLEFLGDSVLGLVVARRVFERYPDLLEGEMTKIKSSVVSRQTCAVLARSLGLPELLDLGKGMRSAHVLPQSLAAGVFESVVAAIYLDGGYEAARRFLEPLVDPVIERAHACGHQENFKSVLQHHAQHIGAAPPEYIVLDEKGPDHAKAFKIAVEMDGRRFEACWGQSKKAAEQAAALAALRELRVARVGPDGVVQVLVPVDGTPATPE
jgi:ribonuclease-3